MKNLVLSIFPGIDLLGKGFELAGYCVVRGPDLVWGGDVRQFHPPAGVFEGVIDGPPCQDFSAARRDEPTGYGEEMLAEFARVVTEAQPEWVLMENVARVPNLVIQGYHRQRIDLNARECGMKQSRLRHFQFYSQSGKVISPERKKPGGPVERIAMASEGTQADRRSFSDFCQLQGLPGDFELKQLTIPARYRAVGNGVPIPMAETMARAVRNARPADQVRLCLCGCGRILTGKQIMATAGCRKRMQRRRDAAVNSKAGEVTSVKNLAKRISGLSR